LTSWWVLEEAEVAGDDAATRMFVRMAGAALAELSEREAVYSSRPGHVGFSAVFEADGFADAIAAANRCFTKICVDAGQAGAHATMSPLPGRALELTSLHPYAD
jgi:hypothetical protein